MFPKPTPKQGKSGKAEPMAVTCNACGCNFQVPGDIEEAPVCPACGETLEKI